MIIHSLGGKWHDPFIHNVFLFVLLYFSGSAFAQDSKPTDNILLPKDFFGEWAEYKCASFKIKQEDGIAVATPSLVSCEATYDENKNETWFSKEKIHVLAIEGDTVYALGEIIPNYKLHDNLPVSKNPVIYHYLEMSFEILTREGYFFLPKTQNLMTIRHRVCAPANKFENLTINGRPDYSAIAKLCKPQDPKKIKISSYYWPL